MNASNELSWSQIKLINEKKSQKDLYSLIGPWETWMPFKTAIFNLVLLIGISTSSNDNALRWMPWDLTDDKSTFAQVMAWCLQAMSYYLSQCWSSSMSPYGLTRPQWVNICTSLNTQMHTQTYTVISEEVPWWMIQTSSSKFSLCYFSYQTLCWSNKHVIFMGWLFFFTAQDHTIQGFVKTLILNISTNSY